MRSIHEEVLRIITANRDWMKKYPIVKAIVLNPKTPLALSLNFFKRLIDMDLKMLVRDKNVAEVLRREVKRFLAAKSPA
jgi:pentose-5-phosphate-3-epimerase